MLQLLRFKALREYFFLIAIPLFWSNSYVYYCYYYMQSCCQKKYF